MRLAHLLEAGARPAQPHVLARLLVELALAAVLRDRIQKVEAAEADKDGTIVQGDFEDDETHTKSRKGKGRRRQPPGKLAAITGKGSTEERLTLIEKVVLTLVTLILHHDTALRLINNQQPARATRAPTMY